MRHTARAHAFTLIELLVVIAIIAVLIGILGPALGGARDRATMVRELARARDLGSAYLMFAADHDDYVLMAQTELDRKLPRPLRVRPTDLQGRPLFGLQARNWFWRLAPYLEHNLGAFYRDDEHLSSIRASSDSGVNYYLSTWYPAMGINYRFVGGDPEYYPALTSASPTRTVRAFGDRFWVKKTTDAVRPSGLIALASSATNDSAAGRVVEGFYQVDAPGFSALNSNEDWASVASPDDLADPASSGNVWPVAPGVVTAAMLDGHAEAVRWRDITDMRRWAPSADAADWRLPLLED